VPGKPTITNSESEVDSSFTLTWSKPTYDGGDDMIKYKVEWRKKPTTDAEVFEIDDISDTKHELKDLEGDAEYEFRVFAKNRAGYSEPDIRSFKVKKDSGMLHLTCSIFTFKINLTFTELAKVFMI